LNKNCEKINKYLKGRNKFLKKFFSFTFKILKKITCFQLNKGNASGKISGKSLKNKEFSHFSFICIDSFLKLFFSVPLFNSHDYHFVEFYSHTNIPSPLIFFDILVIFIFPSKHPPTYLQTLFNSFFIPIQFSILFNSIA